MENPKNSLEQRQPSRTEEINNLIKLFQEGKLTQGQVTQWLETIPENERGEAKSELEYGLMDRTENLPE